MQRMPPHLIPPLLTLCIARIQARPSRAVQVLIRTSYSKTFELKTSKLETPNP